VEALWADFLQPSFWIAVGQIIWINVLLSGDNAVVIALACLTLPPRQRVWGMILGAGVAVLLRIIFTGIVAQIMALPFLKLIGGLALLWIAVKLVYEDQTEGGDKIEAAENLWRAVRIVAIADIVMSLDNVIAIAAAAETASTRVDLANAMTIKMTLIIFGLATSIPLIIAGSAILMAVMERYRILVWAGGALLGWIAGEIIIGDTAVIGFLGATTAHYLHGWAANAGVLFVVALGLLLVRRRRPFIRDEIWAGIGVLVWVVADITIETAMPDDYRQWVARGVVLLVLVLGYFLERMRRPFEQDDHPSLVHDAPPAAARVPEAGGAEPVKTSRAPQ
jgi:YjbE family integral membrane protein